MCVDKHQLHHENHELLFFLVLSLSKLRCCFSSNLSLFPNLFSDRPSFPQLPWSPGHFPGEMPGDRYMCSLWSFLPCTPGATWGNPPPFFGTRPVPSHGSSAPRGILSSPRALRAAVERPRRRAWTAREVSEGDLNTSPKREAAPNGSAHPGGRSAEGRRRGR